MIAAAIIADSGALVFIPGGGTPLVVPINVSAPLLSAPSGFVVGQTVQTTNGIWLNNPTSFTYQWKSAGVNATGAGATSAFYTIASADLGNTLTCTVTPSNGAGAGTAKISAASVAVAAASGAGTNTPPYVMLLAA